MRFSFFAGVLVVAALPAMAQTPNGEPPKTGRKAWTAPRTTDGQPDLQGVWWNSSATPLERPKALEGKPLLTDEELTELKKRAARLFDVNADSDFAGGDNYFLALLANPERYKNPNSTGTSVEMVEREFEHRTSLVVDPADGRIPPLTPEGRQRVRTRPTPTAAGQGPPAGPEDLSNPLRCITYGIPKLGGNSANNSYFQILQTPGYVVLSGEVIHDVRLIPLDGRSHLSRGVRQWHGDSRGRWEGNTLVVDTTNFSSQSDFMGSAENLHLVERFTRTAADTLSYEITLDDPTTWTKPWTAVIRLRQTPIPLYEVACHEGNFYTMEGMLRGARAEEQRAAARTQKSQAK